MCYIGSVEACQAYRKRKEVVWRFCTGLYEVCTRSCRVITFRVPQLSQARHPKPLSPKPNPKALTPQP